MSHFVFKAKKQGGEIYSGERDAADRYELYKMLRESGEEVLSVSEKSAAKGFHINISFGIFGRVKMIEKINLARNLGAMMEAGLALSRALGVLEHQARNKALKAVLQDLIAEISKGNTFSDALGKHPKVFSALFTSMVHAGEQSGTLSESLKVVATQMESTYVLERRIRGAMMYPAVIVTAMIIIAILMLIFVIPVLTKTFLELKVTLPASTRFILGLSDLLKNQGILILLALIIAIAGLRMWSKIPAGKRVIHGFILKIPIIGSLTQEINTARTARTLSSLLSSGVDVVESVAITAAVVQNVHYKRVLENAKEAIKKGDLMSKIFTKEEKLYPVFFGEMMSVGEETGKIGEMLFGVAKYYEADVEQKTKDMSTVIEPFLIIVIGAAVGFFAVSMISPMYSLVNAV